MRNFLLYSLSPLKFCFLHVWGPAKPVSSLSSLKFRLFSQVLHWNINSWRQLLQLLNSSTVCLSVGWFPLRYHQIMFDGQITLYLNLSSPSQATDSLDWILWYEHVGGTNSVGTFFRQERGAEWDFVESHKAFQEQSSDKNLSLRQCMVFLRLY